MNVPLQNSGEILLDPETCYRINISRSIKRPRIDLNSRSISAAAGRRRKGGERRNDSSCGFVDLRAERSTGWSCDALARK